MRLYCFVISQIFLWASLIFAQAANRNSIPREGRIVGGPLVTAAAAKDQVRLTALALTHDIRLQVLSQTGEQLYDSGFQPGNRLEWTVRNQQGSALQDGVYGCLVSVVDLYGQVTNRWATFRVRDAAVVFDDASRQPQAGTGDDLDNLTILWADEPAPFTLVSHDGSEGWIESTSGGLSFYAGGVSRSRDSVPQLRLTPEGNLGIGVAEPRARLEVAGLIRASEGFQFSDGTILKMEGSVPVLVTTDSGTSGAQTRVLGIGSTVIAAGATPGVTVRPLASSGGIRYAAHESDTNTWFGLNAGGAITSGQFNSFFGSLAGSATTTGNGNVFFGYDAGLANTSGGINDFVGYDTGRSNTTGVGNSFFGDFAGKNHTTGWDNSFFGRESGPTSTSENYNTLMGAYSDVAPGITNATAIGFQAKVTQSNSLVLGSINGVNGATANTKVGIGTTTPRYPLSVIGQIGGESAAGAFNYAIRPTSSSLTEIFGGGAGGGAAIAINSSANIGIKTSNPRFPLTVVGQIGGESTVGAFNYAIRPTSASLTEIFGGGAGGGAAIAINNRAYVGIGTSNPQEKLHVIGNIIASGTITMGVTSPEDLIPDYVFEPNYKLMPLDQLEQFLAKEKHLPNVPKASEIKKKGLNLSEFQMKLLKQIEELTLYTLQQARTINEQQSAMQRKDEELDSLNARLAAVEQTVVQMARQLKRK